MHQWKQLQINHNNNHKNVSILDYNLQVSDKAVLMNKSVYKEETPYKGSYGIIQSWTNGTVTLKIGMATDRLRK